MADAQKNIKVGLTLPKDRPGADFINGMYERFKSDVETRTNGTLTVEIVYGGALGNPNSRMHLMRSGAIQMSDASDGNYATVYPDIQVLNIPYLFPTEQSAWRVPRLSASRHGALAEGRLPRYRRDAAAIDRRAAGLLLRLQRTGGNLPEHVPGNRGSGAGRMEALRISLARNS